jgi:hypothetical protein
MWFILAGAIGAAVVYLLARLVSRAVMPSDGPGPGY